MKVEEFVFKKYLELQVSNLEEIRQYTCAFIKNRESYKVHGTGVFIYVDNNYYLVSAAHVFDDFEEIAIPLEQGKFLFNPGGVSYTNNFEETRNKDKLDIGFMKLDIESVSEIKKSYKFFKSENIYTNHKPEQIPIYTFFGYPSTLSKISQTRNSFHLVPFFQFSTPSTVEKYKQLDFDPKLNIIMSYDKKRSYSLANKKFTNGPDLFGISGCGLWLTDPLDLLSKNSVPRLVAIMTEWPIKNRKCVIGTRIEIIIDSIRRLTKD